MTYAIFLALLRSLCGQLPVTAPASGNPTVLCFQVDPTQFQLDFTTTPITIHALAAPAFVDGEVPAGTLDGTNTAFTLANTPIAGSEVVYRNGLRMKRGVDYTITAAAITFVSSPITIPHAGDVLQVDYRH